MGPLPSLGGPADLIMAHDLRQSAQLSPSNDQRQGVNSKHTERTGQPHLKSGGATR